MKINDYIYTTNIIPKELCKNLIKQINKKEWQKHTWHRVENDSYASEKKKELDVQPIDAEMQQQMTPYLVKAYHEYNSKFADLNDNRLGNLATIFSSIRFNSLIILLQQVPNVTFNLFYF